jgi:hypothetical protein
MSTTLQEPARLENWCVTPLAASPYTPPECQAHGLHGTVYGHPYFADGDEITTTECASVKVDEPARVTITTRSGSRYVLGEVDPEYERQFPGALVRIVKSYQGAAS